MKSTSPSFRGEPTATTLFELRLTVASTSLLRSELIHLHSGILRQPAGVVPPTTPIQSTQTSDGDGNVLGFQLTNGIGQAEQELDAIAAKAVSISISTTRSQFCIRIAGIDRASSSVSLSDRTAPVSDRSFP